MQGCTVDEGVVVVDALRTESEDVVVEELPPGAIEHLLERESRELLNISASVFAERWASGEYANSDDARITELAMLLP